MLIPYRITIFLYDSLIRIFSLFNVKARKFRNGRKNWAAHLKETRARTNKKVVWVHTASLGEFEQSRPIIEKLKKARKDVDVLLTFFSPTGYEAKKEYSQVVGVHYLPLDTRSNARKFISIVNPCLVIFVKYEFWYYYLKELNVQKIPTLMVSSIFRQNQLLFHWSGSFFKSVFRNVTHFFVQDEESEELISNISREVSVAGDTIIDGIIESAEQAVPNEIIENFVENEPCFLVYKPEPADLKLLNSFIKENQDHIKFVIIPRGIEESKLQNIEDQFVMTSRYSGIQDVVESQLLILDELEIITSACKSAHYAYVGGWFKRRITEFEELAAFGIPLFYGSHRYEEHSTVDDLEQLGVALPVNGVVELMTAFNAIPIDSEKYRSISQAAIDYMHAKGGATEKIVKKIMQLV